MDRYKLEYFIKDRGKTKEQLCVDLNIGKSAFYRKLAGITEFTLSEIKAISHYLQLTNDELLEVFFTKKVS